MYYFAEDQTAVFLLSTNMLFTLAHYGRTPPPPPQSLILLSEPWTLSKGLLCVSVVLTWIKIATVEGFIHRHVSVIFQLNWPNICNYFLWKKHCLNIKSAKESDSIVITATRQRYGAFQRKCRKSRIHFIMYSSFSKLIGRSGMFYDRK